MRHGKKKHRSKEKRLKEKERKKERNIHIYEWSVYTRKMLYVFVNTHYRTNAEQTVMTNS